MCIVGVEVRYTLLFYSTLPLYSTTLHTPIYYYSTPLTIIGVGTFTLDRLNFSTAPLGIVQLRVSRDRMLVALPGALRVIDLMSRSGAVLEYPIAGGNSGNSGNEDVKGAWIDYSGRHVFAVSCSVRLLRCLYSPAHSCTHILHILMLSSNTSKSLIKVAGIGHVGNALRLGRPCSLQAQQAAVPAARPRRLCPGRCARARRPRHCGRAR